MTLFSVLCIVYAVLSSLCLFYFSITELIRGDPRLGFVFFSFSLCFEFVVYLSWNVWYFR
jgi:hypothetical protein